MTITDLCEELRNWFAVKRLYGEFHIINGVVHDLSEYLLDGQYYRIVGSVFNDGVHKFDSEKLKDEMFTGEIWTMAIPKTVIDMVDEINKWVEKYGDAANSPFSSESFGGYSYSKAGANGNDYNGNVSGGWQSVFASRLNKWRKI